MGKFSLKKGEPIANYEVLSHFTDGSFGPLYIIENTRLPGSKYIMKVNVSYEDLLLMYEDDINNGKFKVSSRVDKITRMDPIDRSEREANITDKFNHPNIIKVNDVVDIKGKYKGIIFERLENVKTLEEIIQVRPSMRDIDKRIDFVLQIIKGIRYIQSKNYIHRDLKLDNILVDSDSVVKIIDFGLACHIDEDIKPFANRPYDPPEFYLGKQHINSDLWPTALVCIELLTGKFLFGEKDNKKVKKFIQELLPHIDNSSYFNSEISKGIGEAFEYLRQGGDADPLIVETWYQWFMHDEDFFKSYETFGKLEYSFLSNSKSIKMQTHRMKNYLAHFLFINPKRRCFFTSRDETINYIKRVTEKLQEDDLDLLNP